MYSNLDRQLVLRDGIELFNQLLRSRYRVF